LEADVGQPLYFQTGGLDLSAPHNPVFEACAASLRRMRVPYEILNANEIRRRFPQFHVDDDAIGLCQVGDLLEAWGYEHDE
jgi:sarcosine oxidase